VTKPTGTDSKNHPGDLLLPYLEDRLSSEDRAMVQEHLNSCKECSDELQTLEQLVASLKASKEVFCPEPHALFEFAETGEDPEGKLAGHIDRCPVCREDVAAYRAGCEVAVLPERVHSTYRDRFPHLSPKRPDATHENPFAILTEWLSSLFKAPAFAMATAAAAILVVALIYPRGEIEPYIGLSSVTWKQADDDFASKSLFPGPQKPRVAVLIFFKGFKKPWNQAGIDALYEALAPVVEAQERTEVLSPAQVQATLKGKNQVFGAKEIANSLGKDLNVSAAIIFEIISDSSGLARVDSQAIDTASGGTMRGKWLEAVPENQLPVKLGEAFSALLNPL